MKIEATHLFADVDLETAQRILPFWNPWQEEEPWEVLAVSALGSLFVEDENGGVYAIKTRAYDGLSVAALSRTEFETTKTTAVFAQEYLDPQLTAELIETHGRLGKNECFSPIVLNEAGGNIADPENYAVLDFRTHLMVTGILTEVRNALPDNEEYDAITLENERRRFARVLQRVMRVRTVNAL